MLRNLTSHKRDHCLSFMFELRLDHRRRGGSLQTSGFAVVPLPVAVVIAGRWALYSHPHEAKKIPGGEVRADWVNEGVVRRSDTLKLSSFDLVLIPF